MFGRSYSYGSGGNGAALETPNNFVLPNSPFGTYSLRQRNGYSGSAIRVRRSSDNTEMDIGFVNYELDTASLLSFVGAADGCVKTFYDQSNTNNFSQLTNANQPKIVVSGVLQEINGKPSINFGTQANQWFLDLPSGSLYLAAEFSLFGAWSITDFSGSNAGVFAPSTIAAQGLEILQKNVVPFFYHAQLVINSATRNAGGAGGRLFASNTQTITSIFGGLLSVSAFKNTAAVSLSSTVPIVPLTYNGVYSLGRNSVGYMNGSVQELILYTSSESANRVDIEGMITNHYGI